MVVKKSILLYDNCLNIKEFLLMIFPNQIVSYPGFSESVSSDSSQVLGASSIVIAECCLVFSLLPSWLPPERGPSATGPVSLVKTPTQRLLQIWAVIRRTIS